MKRFLIITLGVLVLVAAIYSFAVSRISAESVGYRLTRTLYAETGLALISEVSPSVRLYPRPTVTLRNVRIADNEYRVVGSVGRVTASLDLSSLLDSQTRFSRIRLDDADINLDLRSSKTYPVDNAFEKLLGAGKPIPKQIEIRDGSLKLRFNNGIVQAFSKADLSVTRSKSDANISISGAADWYGKRVEISGFLSDPAALVRAVPLQARLALAGAGSKFSFSGQVAGFPAITMEGEFKLNSDNPAEILRARASGSSAAGQLPALTLQGSGRLANQVLTLNDAQFGLGGTLGVGALSLAFKDGRVGLDGTIAFDAVDLTNWIEDRRRQTDFRNPLEMPGAIAEFIDTDMRLSVARVTAGPVIAEQLAGSVIAGRGRLIVDVGDASVFGGRLAGRLATEMTPEGAQTTVDLICNDISADQLAAAFGGRFGIGGVVSTRFTGAGRGRTVVELLREFSGAGAVAIAKPLVSRTGLNHLLVGGDDGAYSNAPIKPGDASFEDGKGQIAMEAGRIVVDDVRLTGADLSLIGRIVVDLIAGAYELTGAAELPGTNQDGSITQLPFRLQGTFPTLPELARRARNTH